MLNDADASGFKKVYLAMDLRISGVGLMVDICTNAIVHAFQRFRAPFSGNKNKAAVSRIFVR